MGWLDSCLEGSLRFVSPLQSLQRYFRTAEGKRLKKEISGLRSQMHVLGAGKASFEFASSFVRLVDTVDMCELNGPQQYREGRICIRKSSHPLPDESTVSNTLRLVEKAGDTGEGDAIVFLLTGGASSMFAVPGEHSSLSEKREICGELMRRGTSISELNCVRRHISAVKGGRFAASLFPRVVHTFAISDVPTGMREDIGSGPTLADRTTCADALNVLKKYRVSGMLSPATRRLLSDGKLESIKPGRKEISHSFVHEIAGNSDAVARFVAESRKHGVAAIASRSTLEGDPGKAAIGLVQEGRERLGGKGALVAGGETSLRVPSGSRGGRCQHFVLSGSRHLRNNEALIALGTDGKDGNSNYAGAVWLGCSSGTERYLGEFSSEEFFREAGTGIVTGMTGTNVSDLYIYCRTAM